MSGTQMLDTLQCLWSYRITKAIRQYHSVIQARAVLHTDKCCTEVHVR